MAIIAWPFCVGANRVSDYALIAAPDIFLAAGVVDFFRSRLFQLTVVSDGLERAVVQDEYLEQPYLAIFRSDRSVSAGVDQQDQAGRQLYHAVGFVTAHTEIKDPDTQAIFDACYPSMREALDQVLAEDREIGAPAPTRRMRFPVDGETRGDPPEHGGRR